MTSNRIERGGSVYFGNLDALRFLSFLLVFLFHSFYTVKEEVKRESLYRFFKVTLFGNGNLGVNFFFVLSGFLISYLLILEKEKFGEIRVVDFWKRRILRIWPLFYFCVAFGFFVVPYAKTLLGEIPHETAHLPAYIFFASNFDMIANGLPDSALLSVLWSISVEEQFYLVWPLLLIATYRRVAWTLITLILTSIVFRMYYDRSDLNELHTFSCMGDLAVGGLGAWAVLKHRLDITFSNISRVWIILLYLVLILVFLGRNELVNSGTVVRALERPVIAFIFLAVILEQNYSDKSIFKAGKIKLFVALGKISYGLYCLHFFAILVITRAARMIGIDNLWSVLFVEPLLCLGVTIILAKFSYEFFESPFLRRKEQLARV